MSRMRVKQVAAQTDQSHADLIEREERTQLERLAVTVEEGAQLFGISRATMYKLVRRGEIKSFTMGRARRIAIVILEQYARSQSGA